MKSSKRNRGLKLGLALAGMLAMGAAPAAAQNDGPILRIPKMGTAPTIDGTISADEWAGASAVTGFGSVTGPFPRQQLPADMRAVWHLGYDDANLYLAMHLRVPEGVTLNAQTKSPDDMDDENALLFGDHVEIQITPHAPQRALQIGFGFYKFIVNPFDIWSDYWHQCDEPGNESAWSSGARVKSTWDLNNWWLEMAIPLVGTMKHPDGGMIEKADGLELVMHLVNAGSCVGYSWAGWVPATWQNFDRFYRVKLDPRAPATQFLDTGELVDGELDAKLRMRGGNAKTATVTVEVLDVNRQTVYSRAEEAALAADSWSDFRFHEPALGVPFWVDEHGERDKRNLLRLRVESDGNAIYTAELPFAKQTPELRAQTYEAYVNTLPEGDYKTRVAYIARNSRLRVAVDTDVMGNIPQAVRDAKRFRLRVRPEAGGDPIIDRELDIVKGVGSYLLEPGELEGKYAATIELLNDAGGVVDTREHHFVRVKHEWEGNTIGEERVVIPPFRPIEFNGRSLSTRLASIKLDDGGLWESLEVNGMPLLTAPMRFEGVVGGEEFSWAGQSVKVEKGHGRAFPPEYDQYRFLARDCPVIAYGDLPETEGYEAVVTGRGAVGPIAVGIKSTMNYDGHTRFEISYAPTQGPTLVERLEVALDLFGGINGIFAAREVNGITMASFPADRQGTLWESGSMVGRHLRFKGTFVPLLHLGDGRHGIQFRAASDEGWLLDDAISCQVIERHGDTIRLRLLLVNAPTTLDGERRVDFTIMPLPAVPPPANSRYYMWGALHRYHVHNATGWRKYATGPDNWYLPSDEAFVRLGETFRSGRGAGRQHDPEQARTLPIMMYSSPLAVGAPLPDCNSFLGQWYGDSEHNPGARGMVQYGGRGTDPTGTFAWDQPEYFTEARPNGWDEDLNDNYVWFHQKLTALTETNGCYWDNAEIQHNINLDSGTYGYVRDDGHIQPTNNSYQRRSLMKRLFTMSWLVGRPPIDNSKWPFQAPFQAMAYMMEGNWYVYTEDGTFFDPHAHDFAQLRFFRSGLDVPATIKSKMPGVEHRTFAKTAPRSYLALTILHDVGLDKVNAGNSQLIRQLDERIGFLDREAQAEFIPYWEADNPAGFVEWQTESGEKGLTRWRDHQPDKLFVSVYRSRTEPKRSLLWIVNAGGNAKVTGLRLDTAALTGNLRAKVVVRNAETNLQLRKELPKTVTDERDREELWLPFVVEPRDYVALIVEEGEYVAPPHPNTWP